MGSVTKSYLLTASSYMVNICAFPHKLYYRNSFLIYDFATDPISFYMKKIPFSFLSVQYGEKMLTFRNFSKPNPMFPISTYSCLSLANNNVIILENMKPWKPVSRETFLAKRHVQQKDVQYIVQEITLSVCNYILYKYFTCTIIP